MEVLVVVPPGQNESAVGQDAYSSQFSQRMMRIFL